MAVRRAQKGPSSGPVVLVGFAEAVAAIETAWCLQDEGFTVAAFAREGRREALERVPGVWLWPVTAPEVDAAQSSRDIVRVISLSGAEAVLPLDDMAVWLCDRAVAECEAAGAILVGPRGAQARIALDKQEQLRAAGDAGLSVPPSTLIAAGRRADGDLPGPGPWIVRPAPAVVQRKGQLVKKGGAVAVNRPMVDRLVQGLGTAAIVQPLIDGVGEGVFGLATPDGVVGWTAHRRVRMVDPRGSGSSACRSWPVDPDLAEAVGRFVTSISWQGLFMVELLRDRSGEAWFVELNGRTWGSMALARRRGFAYPAWAVHACLGGAAAPEPPVDPPDLVCRHLGGELVRIAAIMRGPRGGDPRPWPSRRRALLDALTLRRGDAWYNARRGQARVLLAETTEVLASRLRVRRAPSREAAAPIVGSDMDEPVSGAAS